jgi:thiosulfate/3-mercaptopyruvate sulfurtransferase
MDTALADTPSPLIDAATLLAQWQAGHRTVLLDCGFDLADPEAGDRAYAAGHLPGAHRAHLEHDLSAPHASQGAAEGGRHPLPSREAFALRAASWGIRTTSHVVVYDAQGACFAARAWWMLRWLGHAQVTVLDGGLPAWQRAGGALESGAGPRVRPAPPYPLGETGMATLDADAVWAGLGRITLIDARAGERFRGEIEPLDPQAGHIPGARHRFFKDNLDASGCFRPAAELRRQFLHWGAAPAEIVHQCGSGVTACHNLLAMEAAGLHGSRLYPGSWSEWCRDPARPIARG